MRKLITLCGALALCFTAYSQISLDTDFGDNGFALLPNSGDDYIGRMVVTDNYITVGSTITDNGVLKVRVNQLNLDGSPNTNFGTNGEVIINHSVDRQTCSDLIVHDDGKIVICGDQRDNFLNDILLVRFNADGSLDNTFGTGGIALVDHDDQDFSAGLVYDESSEEYYVAGYANTSSGPRAISACVEKDGSLRTSYGTNGTEQHFSVESRFTCSPVLVDDFTEASVMFGGTAIAPAAGSTVCILVAKQSDGSDQANFNAGGRFYVESLGGQTIDDFINFGFGDDQWTMFVRDIMDRTSVFDLSLGEPAEKAILKFDADDVKDLRDCRPEVQPSTNRTLVIGSDRDNNEIVIVSTETGKEVPNGAPRASASPGSGYTEIYGPVETGLHSSGSNDWKAFVAFRGQSTGKAPNSEILIVAFGVPGDTIQTSSIQQPILYLQDAYPNPFDEYVYVMFPSEQIDKMELHVYNASGQAYLNYSLEKNTDRMKLIMPDAAPGVYTVQVVAEEKVYFTKVVKK